jgi:hypothetical protein
VEDAVAAGTEADFLKELGSVFELGGEMAIGATALEQVFGEGGLGAFDAGEGEVAGLDEIALVTGETEILA